MASNTPVNEDPCNSAATDEETLALKRKRSRRVSFAEREITSVHVFKRDEDYDTPPNSSAVEKQEEISESEREVQEFFGNLVDSNEWKDSCLIGGADGDDVGRKSFFRLVESPSPGSSILGSATSDNEEDNFFGPVSANFIRTGRLSDSAASDDTHDVTMDSTAFSMHYRSLAKSESGELKTSTEVPFATEDKTPSQVSPASILGSSMVLTKAKKLTGQGSVDLDKATGGRDSNDMSLVGENLHSYDYEKLSPGLEALLAEGRKNLHAASVADSVDTKSMWRSEASALGESGSYHIFKSNDRDEELGNVGKHDSSPPAASQAYIGLDEANGDDQVYHDCSSDRPEDLAANMSTDQQIQTPSPPSKVQSPKQISEVKDDTRNPGVGMDAELPAIGNDTTPRMDRKIHHLDSLRGTESRGPSVEDLKLESTVNGGIKSYAVIQNSDKHHPSPVSGSTSSFAKQKQISSNAIKSVGLLSHVTPSPRQPGSFLSNEYIKGDEIVSSLNKSSSKFKIFEPSPLASSLKDAVEKSKLRLLKFRSPATSFNTIAEENNQYFERKLIDVPIVNLNNHLFSVYPENREQEGTSWDGEVIGTPKNFGSLSISKVSTSDVEDEEPLICLSPAAISDDRASQQIIELSSSSQFTGSQKKLKHHTLVPANAIPGTLVTPASNHTSAGANLDNGNGVDTVSPSDKFISPPVKRLDQRISSIMDCQGSLSDDLKHNLSFIEPVSIGSEPDRNAFVDLLSHSHSPAVAEELSSLSKTHLSSVLIGIDHIADSCQVKEVDGSQTILHDMQHISKTSVNSLTPLRKGNAATSHSGNVDGDVLHATDSVHIEGELSGENIKTYPCASVSLIHGQLLKSPFKKELPQSPRRKDLPQSPSRKDPCNALSNGFFPFNMENMLSPNSNCEHGYQSSALDIKDISSRKRRIGKAVLGDLDIVDEIRRIKKSPSIHRGRGFMMEHSHQSDYEREMVRDGTVLRHSSDISLKFSTDTNHMLPPLIDKLNMKEIDVLQDILEQLKKAKMFQMLSCQIQSQTMNDPSGKVMRRRLDETRWLLYELVYERARLQLISVKYEKLLKKMQQLRSALQDSQVLKSTSLCPPPVPDEREVPVDDNFGNIFTSNFGRTEVSKEKVIAMRNEFEALDRAIKSLAKCFHSYCKIKEEPCCTDTIVLVNDHLKKRSSCRFIHEYLQLWEIEDFGRGSKSGQLKIILSYRGFICQIVTVDAGPVPSIYISNELKEVRIEKNFPNMDACTAFSCVLSSEFTENCAGYKNLAQATQITSSCIHNLLDVVKEVQLAQIEFKNLVQTTFCSSAVERLELQLCFLNFRNFSKVTIALDMTCLKWGFYPLEVVPHQLEASVAGTNKSLTESLSSKINVAVQSLRIGYPRIIKLCECVSQVMSSLST